MVEALEPKLAELRAGASKRLPAKILELTQELVANLERAHVAKALDVGDTAPDFRLKKAGSGQQVTLSEALKIGPLVVSFYRGQW